MRWDGKACSGKTAKFSYAAAKKAAGAAERSNGWRIPTRDELVALVDMSTKKKPHIDPQAFPKTPAAPFWAIPPGQRRRPQRLAGELRQRQGARQPRPGEVPAAPGAGGDVNGGATLPGSARERAAARSCRGVRSRGRLGKAPLRLAVRSSCAGRLAADLAVLFGADRQPRRRHPIRQASSASRAKGWRSCRRGRSSRTSASAPRRPTSRTPKAAPATRSRSR